MDIFKTLGETVNQEWKRAGYDDARLPDIAVEALTAANLCERVSIEDICAWCFQADTFPFQPNLKVEFGQPPLTVYENGRLYIEVLFWLENTTSIHQHAFSGAFYVLAGSSMHSVYSFQERERITDRLSVGDITLEKMEHLNTGELHPIRSGGDYIHSLFHLGYPSATVVVRNYSEPSKNPQYTYMKPSVAIDRHVSIPHMQRQAQLFKMLMTVGHPNAQALLLDWLRQADLESSFRVLVQLYEKGQLSIEQRDEALEVVTSRHGPTAAFIQPALDEVVRANRVFSRRQFITEKNHRLFLALMATSPGREKALALIQAMYPDQNPSSLIFSWIQEMNSADATRLAIDEVQHMFGASPVAPEPVPVPVS